MAANLRSLLFMDIMRFAGASQISSLALVIRAIGDVVIQARAINDVLVVES